MDITQLFPLTKDLVIHLPDGSPTDIVFKVIGQDSKRFHEAARKHVLKGLERVSDTKTLTEEQLLDKARDGAALLASCIVGWENVLEGGQPVPYSTEKAIEYMLNPELAFIREQVEGFVTKRTHFFRPGVEPTN